MSAGPSTIRIMTVDDHPLLRQGIATLIKGQPDMEVVAEASDGEEAIAQFRRAPARRDPDGSANAECEWYGSDQPH